MINPPNKNLTSSRGASSLANVSAGPSSVATAPYIFFELAKMRSLRLSHLQPPRLAAASSPTNSTPQLQLLLTNSPDRATPLHNQNDPSISTRPTAVLSRKWSPWRSSRTKSHTGRGCYWRQRRSRTRRTGRFRSLEQEVRLLDEGRKGHRPGAG